MLCILTDATAQFFHPNFPGKELVHIIPTTVTNGDGEELTAETLKMGGLPVFLPQGSRLEIGLPDEDDFRRTLEHLGGRYEEILVLLPSGAIGRSVDYVRRVAKVSSVRDSVTILDTQSVSVGLGLIVMEAAQAALKGLTAGQIKKDLLGLMNRLYAMFCVDGLTYLANSGFLAPSQAMIGEMLKVRPLYMLEKGHLVPVQKARNTRHLVESLHEFVSEFENVKHLALVQGIPPFEHEARALRDRISDDLPDTPVSEHIISPPLAVTFGPHTLGVFVWEGDTGAAPEGTFD